MIRGLPARPTRGGYAPALAFCLSLAAAATSLPQAQAQAPAAAPRALAPMRALEQALETRSGAVILPSGGIGNVVVTPCAGCKPVSMVAGSETRWLLGERSVGFAEVQRVLATGPRVPVLVFYRAPGGALTRLVARVPETAR
jgi:hypothetical protein